MKWLTKFGVVAAAMLAAAQRMLAQGCAMCYADAAAQSPRARHQLDIAILTLLIPSVLLFAGVLVAAFRRRAHEAAEETQPEGNSSPAPQLSIPAGRRGITPGTAPDSV